MIIRSLAILLLAAGLAFGQQPAKKETPKEPAKPVPGSLEDTLEKSLRNSADIKAAEAKVRDAEAELNRVRSQVLTKATTLHSDLNLAKRLLTFLEADYKEHERLFKIQGISQNQLIAAQAPLEKQRGEIEKLEAELKSLRGEFAITILTHAAFDSTGQYLYTQSINEALRIWDVQTGKLLQDRYDTGKAAAVQTPMAERVRKLLDQEVQWMAPEVTVDVALDKVLKAAKSDIPYRILLGQDFANLERVNMEGKLSVGAWLQAIEDTDPKIRIVVREYGFLLTLKDRVPMGAIGVSELWKAKEAKPKEGPKLDKK